MPCGGAGAGAGAGVGSGPGRSVRAGPSVGQWVTAVTRRLTATLVTVG